ncbi:hypothetical protein BDR07DRAFT_1272175 [Suillus spraguei]|nr:hypothetical protein BDR07DRAFT_1272175 [Suillus spraguei]
MTHSIIYLQFQSSDAPHEAKLSHELLGGAVAFEAAKAYEDHCARNGQPQSHALAKELFAGFAGAAVDRLVETKGADAWSAHQRQKAREHGMYFICHAVIYSDKLFEAVTRIDETFTEDVYVQQNY